MTKPKIQNKARRAPINVILFDIDGVLVDVRRSYLETIRRTVQFYLEHILAYSPLEKPLLSIEEVEQFKWLGGFNNDWDCSFALLVYLVAVSEGKLSLDTIARRKKISSLAHSPQKLAQLNRLVQEARTGEWLSYPVLKRVFQEHYLGSALFKKLYRSSPQFYHGKGAIWQEKPLFPKSVFAALQKRNKEMSIVTGRIRFEADFVLKRFGIRPFFRVIVSADDVFSEEEKQHRKTGRRLFLGKPHPFSLLKAAEKLGRRNTFLYVGDIPDDIRAAKAARSKIRVFSAGFLGGASQSGRLRKKFRKAGADFVWNRPQEILKLQ